MNARFNGLLLNHLVSALLVLAIAVALGLAGMHPAAAAGAACVMVASFEGSTRRRAGRCASDDS